jgi:hypothetical protein
MRDVMVYELTETDAGEEIEVVAQASLGAEAIIDRRNPEFAEPGEGAQVHKLTFYNAAGVVVVLPDDEVARIKTWVEDRLNA